MNDYSDDEIKLLSNCTLCPRMCGVNRIVGALGFCNTGAGFGISSICMHKGEEPVISGEKGICNIFFSRCNMQCTYCQNHHISGNKGHVVMKNYELKDVVKKLCEILEQTENIIGFVSPTHQVPQMLAILRELQKAGKNPIVVYNSNAYDRAETLRMLEGIVDVYLPDFKYSDERLSVELSKAPGYPSVAIKAIKEMYRQKGSSLILNNENIALSGIIIRHLILPGYVEQSIEVLRMIAEVISPDMHISLMSQYFPTDAVKQQPFLNRTITTLEFKKVEKAFYDLGFYRGWLQELQSHAAYRPDFSQEQPFKD